jgi:Arrestin (or S-antigen), N-terminal domain
MIFNKILKGNDLTFDLSLEKIEYRPGEIVRGNLTLKTEKSCKARKLMLFAEGKESTIIRISESTGSDSNRHTATRTYSEINTFFLKDLSHLLQKSVSSNTLQDETLEILPQNKEIAFDFTLPTDNNLFSSYKGKLANITYTVKATADIAKKFDVTKEEQFSIINPNKAVSHSWNTSYSEDNNNKIDSINTTTIEKQNGILRSPTIEVKEEDKGKESYSARFEKIFGKKGNDTSSTSRPRYFTFSGSSMNLDLGTIFAKGRDHFLKENSEAKIDLVDHENNNTSYSPGQMVKGQVIKPLLPPNEEEKKKKIRGMKITLCGIEDAFAQGVQRVNTIEKYEKNIELNGNEYGGNNVNNTIPFEFEIPQRVNQSFRGKYSEYFWGLEVKVNIAWSSDMNARTLIEII